MRTLQLVLAMALGMPGAWASSTFDPLSGTGLVPGRDVQTLLGWTDAQFQERAPAVGFSYRMSGEYSAVRVWNSAQGARVEERRSVNVGWQAPVTSSLRRDPRDSRRIDAFMLFGFGSSPQRGDAAPLEGAPCTGAGGTAGAWQAVLPQKQSNTLLAHFGGVDVVLPF